jgi:hypothetical protein
MDALGEYDAGHILDLKYPVPGRSKVQLGRWSDYAVKCAGGAQAKTALRGAGAPPMSF